MTDIDPLGQFSGVNFPPPMKPLPLRDQPVQPPPAAGQVAPPSTYAPGTGIIDFFRSLFHRQNDLDDIMKQNGIRGDAAPATGGIRG